MQWAFDGREIKISEVCALLAQLIKGGYWGGCCSDLESIDGFHSCETKRYGCATKNLGLVAQGKTKNGSCATKVFSSVAQCYCGKMPTLSPDHACHVF